MPCSRWQSALREVITEYISSLGIIPDGLILSRHWIKTIDIISAENRIFARRAKCFEIAFFSKWMKDWKCKKILNVKIGYFLLVHSGVHIPPKFPVQNRLYRIGFHSHFNKREFTLREGGIIDKNNQLVITCSQLPNILQELQKERKGTESCVKNCPWDKYYIYFLLQYGRCVALRCLFNISIHNTICTNVTPLIGMDTP